MGRCCLLARHAGHAARSPALLTLPIPCRALTPLRPLCLQSYSVALYLVRQLTSSELLQRLKTIGVKHPELCKALGEHCGAFPGLPGSVPALTAEPPLLGACRLWGDTHMEPGSLRRSLGDANGAGSQRWGALGALTDLSVLRVRQGMLRMWGLFGAS